MYMLTRIAFVFALTAIPGLAYGSWCPPDVEALIGFDLENGKTVSVCPDPASSEFTYFYGTLGEDPELVYRGPLLAEITGVLLYNHVPEEIMASADSGGFYYVHSEGCCGGEEWSYLFRRGGWLYAVREGYSRIVNPEIAAAVGDDYDSWWRIQLRSPDGREYLLSGRPE